jgi:phosphoserine phosphatase RsbU/P
MIGDIKENTHLRQQSTLRRLHDISIKLLGELELGPLVESITVGLVDLLQADTGNVYLYDPGKNELVPWIPLNLPREALYPMKPGEGAAGKVFLSGNALRLDNYDEWEGRSEKWPIGVTGTLVQAPIKKGDEILGVLAANRYPGKPFFTDEDLDTAQLFASQAAVAISNARLYEQAKKSAEQLASVYETSLEVTSQLELDQVLERIIRRAAELSNSKSGQFYLYDSARKHLASSIPYNLTDAVRANLKKGEGLSGRVLASKKPLIVEDYDTWEGRSPQFPFGVYHKAIGVPVQQGGKVLGVLNLHRDKEDAPFGEEDTRLLTLIASQAAIAISNARAYESIRRTSEQLSQLYETSLEITQQLEIRKLMERIIERAAQIVQAKSGQYYLYDKARAELVPTVPYKLPQQVSHIRLKPGEGMSGKVLLQRKPLVIDDYDSWEGRSPQFPKGVIFRTMGVPLEYGNEVLGVLTLERDRTEPGFSNEDVRLLSLFASQAAVALANAQAFETAQRTSAQLSRLHDITLEVTRQLEIQQLLDQIIRSAVELANSRFGQIYLYDKSEDVLKDSVSYNLPKSMHGFNIKPGEGLTGRILKSGKPMIVEEYDSWAGRKPEVPIGTTHHAAGVPIEHGDGVLGVFWVGRKKGDPAFSEYDIQLMTLFANQAAVAITNAKQYKELQSLYGQLQEKERLESELRVAHNIQETMLPSAYPKIRGWSVAAMWKAARVISGDFYDWFPIPGGKWGFVIADVVGKGIPGAVFMAHCRTLVRTFCMGGRPPRDAIRRTNNLMIADTHSDWFVTLFYAVLDPVWGIFTYVNAGHIRPLWLHNRDNRIVGLKAKGMALGVLPEIDLEERSIQVQPGDSILFYTDGFSEARDARDRFFGENRIRAHLKQMSSEEPQTNLQSLKNKIADFSRGRELTDDLTAILIKRRG